jgi:FKBP-type peptidyl-prolyl cis-trans isomerase FkpA
MKTAALGVLLISSLLVTACNQQQASNEPSEQAPAEPISLETDSQKRSYAIGTNMGKFSLNFMEQRAAVGQAYDQDLIIKGFLDTMGGNSLMDDETLNATLMADEQEFKAQQQALAQQQEADNKSKGAAYLAENAKKEGVTVTESGLQYEVITAGESKQPKATDTVKVHYRGTLLDGTEFDSSYSRGTPATFPLNRVIAGWTEGLQLMKEGAKFKFHIPSELAYGARSTGAITPHSTLLFEVELLEVVGEE